MAAVAVLALNACGSPYYTADPIEAWVVDSETGQPIEGAVVTANWQLVGFTLDTGGSKKGQLAVMETVTDKNGRFFFPGFTKVNPSLGELRDEDPQVLIFKPGYRYVGGGNNSSNEGPHRNSHRKAQVNGKTIQMRKTDPDPRKQATDLSILSTNISNIWNSGDGYQIPQMLRALACESKRLQREDPRALVPYFDDGSAGQNCDRR